MKNIFNKCLRVLLLICLIIPISVIHAETTDSPVNQVKIDKDTVSLLQKAAEQGDMEAQAVLGYVYSTGKKGVAQDEVKALYWYKKAAEQGDAGAQSSLGLMYSLGEGVAKDNIKALYWFEKAAEQGDAISQSALGFMYHEGGQGVSKDETKAFYWFKKAAEQGNAADQYTLGKMYSGGYGVAKDYTRAFYWFEKSAHQDYASAQTILGMMYYTGEGTTKDETKALYWFEKAAEQGDKGAKNYLDLIRKSNNSTKATASDKLQSNSQVPGVFNYIWQSNSQAAGAFNIFSWLFFLAIFLVTFGLMRWKYAKPYKKLSSNTCYVGFWRRFVAGSIDTILLSIIFAVASALFAIVIGVSISLKLKILSIVGAGFGVLFVLLFDYLYNVLFQMSKYQATLGMMIMRFKIYDETLKKAGFWRLSGRYFSRAISGFILFIGYFMIGWTKRKQGLHDIVARTVCVRKISPLE